MAKKPPEDRAASPGALTARRFLRNPLAVVGLCVLVGLFVFSFVGGALSPYGEDQVFYRTELQYKQLAAVTENAALRFVAAPGRSLTPVVQAQLALHVQQGYFESGGVRYDIAREGPALYTLWQDGTCLGLAGLDIVSGSLDFEQTLSALRAYGAGEAAFTVGSKHYTLEGGNVLLEGQVLAHISRLVISGEVTQAFRRAIEEAIAEGADSFSLEGRTYSLSYDAFSAHWSVGEQTQTQVWDSYASPSAAHPLGTDKNGMDMLTRLMYGGRVSLVIGFAVVLLSAVLGVVLGGIAGYFGRWVDALIMRAVDVFYCIPSTPLLIILGAAMDAMRVQPQVRMVLLMLVLGFLGWPVVARLVRGQILSLREQEFMVAAEATGLRVRRRIFRHLLPNVIPQLIVTCTMSLGSTVITEATLSFLGLGVKFPFASWGNMINDVSSAHVLTSYWFVWIPAGVCLMLAVLGFNFVGDGLRDAFDPKMRR